MIRSLLEARTRFYVLAAAVAPLTLAAGCNTSHGGSAAAEQSALYVDTAAAERQDGYPVQREFSGRIEARRVSRVGFEIGGALTQVLVDEGDRVAAGSVLARLDTAALSARRDEAAAALAQALSAEAFATRSLQRNRDAAGAGGISEQALDAARDAATSAAANVAAARARLASVDVDLDRSVLKAPYDAIVIRRQLDEGEIVSAGLPVLALQEIAALQVRIGVAGDLSRVITAGESRQLRIGARVVDATVTTVLPVRDAATRTIDVILDIAPDDGVLPGDLARLVVEETVAAESFRLPIAALAEGSRGLWTAYVAVPFAGSDRAPGGATHQLEPRAVEILHESTSHVYVRGALEPGERYVTGGLQRVVPGQPVRLDATLAAGYRRVPGT